MARIHELHKPHLLRDLVFILASIGVAYLIARTDAVALLSDLLPFAEIEAFFVGIFFTSLLTIAPAGVAFAEMSHSIPLSTLAAWGAAGAVVGDLCLFLFFRDAISADIVSLLRGSWLRKLKALFKTPFLSWAVPLAGALVIASPLPDEIGIAMLGLSKTDLRFLVPISFAMNYLGILLIGVAA